MNDDYIRRHGVSAWLHNMEQPWLADAIMDKERFPPEDVQPVVRCSECEHWNEGICYCDDYEIHCQDYYIGDMHTEPDFFCGFGKRKGRQ